MTSPNITGERLRNHLDANQTHREGMCLALLPLLGKYSEARPRRPRGGPDGGRDIEAVFGDSEVVFGAIGFQNGGGADQASRNDTIKKFKSDLRSALKNKSDLTHFVFFTNVDLTPGQKEELVKHSAGLRLQHTVIFDFEILRSVLDSPRGLLARLQYLDIAMDKTEQLALINGFGDEIHSSLIDGFDRVGKTLSEMQRFLDFNKPIYRIDVIIELSEEYSSEELESAVLLLKVMALLDKPFFFLITNTRDAHQSDDGLLTNAYSWTEPDLLDHLHFKTRIDRRDQLAAVCQISLTSAGRPILLSDPNSIGLIGFANHQMIKVAQSVQLRINHYTIFERNLENANNEVATFEVPICAASTEGSIELVQVIERKFRQMNEDPPGPIKRKLRLHSNTVQPPQK